MPRWTHQFYAWAFGYFWIPCPNCGRNFGGHEKPGGSIYRGCGISQLTCSRCKIGFQPMNGFDGTPFTRSQVAAIQRRYLHA